MNEQQQLQNALINFVNLITQTVEEGKDFAVAQMPDVINQLLYWNFTKSFLLFLLSITLIGLSLGGIVYSIRKMIKENYVFKDIHVAIIFVASLLIMPSIFLFSIEWLKILIAPKIFVLEYMKNFIVR